MSVTQTVSQPEVETARARSVDLKLEVVVLPVSDVDRAKRFYGSLGWRLDADIAVGDSFRVVQFTPPGSPASIHFGKGLTTAAPGSTQRTYLVVSDIDVARTDLIRRGVPVSEVFHNTAQGPRGGPDPQRRTYASLATFSDPDGNTWLLQEISARLPGRVDVGTTTFGSAPELGAALRRAAAAHGEREKRTGRHDSENWPEWYAEYMVSEQTGKPLPT